MPVNEVPTYGPDHVWTLLEIPEGPAHRGLAFPLLAMPSRVAARGKVTEPWGTAGIGSPDERTPVLPDEDDNRNY